MRKIKFRSWDNNDRLMHDVIVLQRDEFVAIPEVGPDGWELRKRKLSAVNLMQFTGLTDKNGKEIYEGDVVRKLSTSLLEDMVGVVEFQRGRYILRKGNITETFGAVNGAFLEVIGNIYENPELLK